MSRLLPGALFCTCLACSIAWAGPSQAGSTPFHTSNQSPFSLISGLPQASPARLLNPGQTQWSSSLNLSNTLIAQSRPGETLLLDVETWHLQLNYDYGLGQNWMLRLQLPLISHRRGFMDDPIDSYHRLLGLSEGSRPFFPQDQINIRYELNNSRLIDIQAEQSALGDISLQLAWQALKNDSYNLSLWSSLQLPSGDSDRLTGNDATEIAVWLSGDMSIAAERWLYAQLGALYLSDGDVLQPIQNNLVGFSTLGLQFEPWHHLAFKFQLDIHTALYDSQLKFLQEVIQLSFGGSYLINKQHQLDVVISEDINTNTSPDVTFQINWRYRY